MKIPEFPPNEKERLVEVESYNLLDTLPEAEFDNLSSLTALICDVPIALITILDTERNFFKSHYGIPYNEAPRDLSFCGHAILEKSNLFVVEDTKKDNRFKDNPTCTEAKVRFYAGAPLISKNGFPLGTLCIFDFKPRILTEKQKETLISLSKQVMSLFELHKNNKTLREIETELKERNKRLKSFANLVSHDLKSPLANITSLTRLLREENKDILSEDSIQYINYIAESSDTLRQYINGILKYYKSDELLKAKRTDVPLGELFEEIKEMLIIDDDELIHPTQPTLHNVNKSVLTQILLNLIDNGLKYNSKKDRKVTVMYSENLRSHCFSVIDNGIGIEEEVMSEIFNLFKTTGKKDRHGNEGTGIGLATVKSLVNKMGGTIRVNSKIGEGTTFRFTVQK